MQRIAEIETGLQPAVGTPQLEHPARDSRRPKDRKARLGPVEIGTKPGCTQIVLGISLDRRIQMRCRQAVVAGFAAESR